MIASLFGLRYLWDWVLGLDPERERILRLVARRSHIDRQIKAATGRTVSAQFVSYDAGHVAVFDLPRPIPISAILALVRLSVDQPEILERLDAETIVAADSIRELENQLTKDHE